MRATRPCPVCGFVNPSDAGRCLKCSAGLTESNLDDLLNRRPGVGARASERLARWLAPWRRRAERLAGEVSPEVAPGLDYRSPGLAALLAVVPGGGCLYNHRPRRALVFALITAALGAVCLATLRWPHNNWLLGALALWTFYACNDAMAMAARHNGQLWTYRHVLAGFFAILFAVSVTASLGQFLLSPVFTFVILQQDVLRPTLAKGDRIFVWKAGYRVRAPRRGEVVFYDPPRYRIHVHGDAGTAASRMQDPNRPVVSKMEMWSAVETTVFTIDESRSFGRVNALGGDVVERRAGGPVLLNGEPMPPAFLPLTPAGLPADFHIEVPEDKVCVLIAHFSQETVATFLFPFGSVAPAPGDSGIRLEGWAEACVVPPRAIAGRATAIYHPPPRRRWLGP